MRFNRHAVYLGAPSQKQSCPGHTAGRSEAILLEPVAASAARATAAREAPSLEGSATSFLVRSGSLRVTATWKGDRRLIAARAAPPHTSRAHSPGAGTQPWTPT